MFKNDKSRESRQEKRQVARAVASTSLTAKPTMFRVRVCNMKEAGSGALVPSFYCSYASLGRSQTLLSSLSLLLGRLWAAFGQFPAASSLPGKPGLLTAASLAALEQLVNHIARLSRGSLASRVQERFERILSIQKLSDTPHIAPVLKLLPLLLASSKTTTAAQKNLQWKS